MQLLSGGAILLLILVGLLWRAKSSAVSGEKKLAVERQRLSDVIEGTHVGTWEVNLKTRDLAFNDRWAEIIGYSRAELSPTQNL